MTERLAIQQTLEPDNEAAALPFEIAQDIENAKLQFVDSLETLVESEVQDLKAELGAAPDTLSLQEKHGTAYEPYKVVTGIAARAMEGVVVLSTPALARDYMAHESLKTIAKEVAERDADVIDLAAYRNRKAERESTMNKQTIYRENGLAYAQDQPETKKYATEATSIIDALIAGDESRLGGLPHEFKEALRIRMESYENGVSSEEREAMISVACNALAKKDGEISRPEAKTRKTDEEHAA